MTYTAQKLKLELAHFQFRLEQFAELLNMTCEEVEELKEVDDSVGHYFYSVYMNFHKGVFPSEDFVNRFQKVRRAA